MSDDQELPDGSGFFVGSLPLPKDHWLYAPQADGWDSERDCSPDTPKPILDDSQREAVKAALRWAVRGATMCGTAPDYDPDALVLNAAYALCGPSGAVRIACEVPALTTNGDEEVVAWMNPKTLECGDGALGVDDSGCINLVPQSLLLEARAQIAELQLDLGRTKPIDAADPDYPNAQGVADTLRNCQEDLLTEARFVLWQAAQIAERDRKIEELETLCRDGFDALHECKKCMKECDEPSALERLRFFCSCAMRGQDWLDVEPFFQALEDELAAFKGDNRG